MEGLSMINSIAALTPVSSKAVSEITDSSIFDEKTTNSATFDSLYESAITLLDETNALQNARETEEINFALGYSNDTHTLEIAQEKAAIALQYTVAVRDKFLESYDKLMNMQI